MTRRKRQARKVKPVYYVFCEDKTEETYVRFLKQHYRIPIAIDCHVSKLNITNRYIQKYKRNKPSHPKDKTFVMYDLDKKDVRDKLIIKP